MPCRVAIHLVLLASLAGGCAGRTARPDDDQLADLPMLASVRADIERTDPNAIVGYVIETLPSARLAAIAEVPLDQFRVGEIVTFIDPHQKRLTHGRVVRITSHQLHAEYQPPPRDGRAPRPGDMAVRFKTPP